MVYWPSQGQMPTDGSEDRAVEDMGNMGAVGPH